MGLMKIIHYPHETLLKKAAPVTEFGPELAKLAEDMAASMYAAHGLGLAAVQVNVSKQLCIIDMGESREEEGGSLMVFVNPEIVESHGEISWEEGCLSFPELTVKVRRAERVLVRAQDLNGEPFEVEAEGLFAVALQHETDHLNGVTMVDRLGRLSRKLALRRYRKARAQAQEEERG